MERPYLRRALDEAAHRPRHLTSITARFFDASAISFHRALRAGDIGGGVDYLPPRCIAAAVRPAPAQSSLSRRIPGLTTYDNANRLTGKTLPNGIKQTYTYDAANRLTELQYAKSDGTLIEQITYEYDANGRRTARTSLANLSNSETPIAATYDLADRLTALTINPATPAEENYTLTYEGNGNLARKEGLGTAANKSVTYTWDGRDRLVAIQGNGITASFAYDAYGRRTGKTVNGQTIQYVYDGNQAIGELRNYTLDTTLLTGLEIDEVIARYSTQGTATYLTDALGTVIAQARADQTILNSYQYSPYGETTVSGPDDGNSIQYTARENDNTGLYFYRARYYDAVLKRFVSEDPIGLAGGMNVAAYVGGNPVGKTDPFGLSPFFERDADLPWPCNTGRCFPGGPTPPLPFPAPPIWDITPRDVWNIVPCEVKCDIVVSLVCKPLVGATETFGAGFAVWAGCNLASHLACQKYCSTCPPDDPKRLQP